MELPGYVDINDASQDSAYREQLYKESADVTIPLTQEDLRDIEILKAKYEAEVSAAGLAAIQIGIPKKIMVVGVKVNEELQARRPDIGDGIPTTVLVNATYEALGEQTYLDFEGCYSVSGFIGLVERPKHIICRALLPNGETFEAEYSAFVGRVIQHEIDHTMGVLWTDRAKPEHILTRDVFDGLVAQAREAEKPILDMVLEYVAQHVA